MIASVPTPGEFAVALAAMLLPPISVFVLMMRWQAREDQRRRDGED